MTIPNTSVLNVADVINVTVTLSPIAAGMKNFGIALILGDTDGVIDITQRYRIYTTLSQVLNDFSITAPEYLGAVLHFAQNPQPNILYIGRWASAATRGILHGTILTAVQQALSNFTGITTGSFYIQVDGVPMNITGLNFSAQTNLNGVASTIQTQLRLAGATNATVVFNSIQGRFDITSGTTGVNSTLSFAQAGTPIGNAAFGGNPTGGDTLTLGGTAITFVTGTPGVNQIQIGSTLAITLTNLVTFINTAFAQITAQLSNAGGSIIYFISKTTGVVNNGFTMSKVSSTITLSGATLTGGAADTTSTTLGLISTITSATPVPGIAAETPLQAVQALVNATQQWYALEWATTAVVSTADYVAVAGFIEGLSGFIQGTTTQDTNILNALVTNDLASQLKSLGYNKTFVQYSSVSPYASISLWARQATVNFNANNTVITLKFKQEPSVGAEFLTETQAATLKTKNCNVFVQYANDTAIIQEGVMSGGWFIDERVGLDWLQNAVQTALYNLFYTSLTKVPQTDAGTNLMLNTVVGPMQQGITNGLIAPGIWTGPATGQVATNDNLPLGYYLYAPLVATQAAADRAARKGVPITALVKLAGAVHFANVAILVAR